MAFGGSGAASRFLCAAFITFVLPVSAGLAQGQQTEDSLSAELQRLNINIPLFIQTKADIRRGLDELRREPCDKSAIAGLGEALKGQGYRREAANAHIRFSETCKGHAPSLREAVNIQLQLSDHAAAAGTATALIALEPFHDNGYFLRGLANFKAEEYSKAIDDFATATDLFGNKARISSIAYYHMAQSYEKLGQPCNAVGPIETWINLNPQRNDTSQARAMISSLVAKGNCPKVQGKEAVFPITQRGQTVQIPVTINGTKGTFILDTGATFVALRRSFAEKAKVDVFENTSIQLHTANGTVTAKRGRAKTIEVKSLKADEIPVVVQTDATGTYGKDVDGLLGMSFLSRFQISMDNKSLKLRARDGHR
jgi:aspartyl protease family protein